MRSDDSAHNRKARKHQRIILWSVPITVLVTLVTYYIFGFTPALLVCLGVLAAIYTPLIVVGSGKNGSSSHSHPSTDR
ncbi:hypothetical protein GCM10009582_10170 [Arthrobacter flavus]